MSSNDSTAPVGHRESSDVLRELDAGPVEAVLSVMREVHVATGTGQPTDEELIEALANLFPELLLTTGLGDEEQI